MNWTPHEISPRFRRRSTIRPWSKKQELELMEIERTLDPSMPEEQRAEAMSKLWQELGYTGYTADELLKKMQSIHRIRSMLQHNTTAPATEVLGQHRKGSLLEDAQWEEETLHMVRAGKSEEFKARLRGERRASQVSDAHGRTALHHACSAGNMTLVEALVESGAELELRDKDGRTPIFFCLEHAWDEVTEWLLERGARVDIADNLGVTPLHLAVYTNSRRATRLLIKAPGVDINHQDSKGQAPLHIAAHRASVEVLQLLLEAGADPSLRDKRGNLPKALADRMAKGANARVLSMRTAGQAVLATVKLQNIAAAAAKAKADGSPQSPA